MEHSLPVLAPTVRFAYGTQPRSSCGEPHNRRRSMWQSRLAELRLSPPRKTVSCSSGTRLRDADSQLLTLTPVPSIGVSVSATGRQVATASQDGIVRLWDPATGQQLATFEGHTDRVYGTAFSYDGRYLASCSHDGTVRLWNLLGRRLDHVLKQHVYKAAFSADGVLATLGLSGPWLLLWDPRTGRIIRAVNQRMTEPGGLAWSPDGRRIACASYDRVWVYNATNCYCTAELKGHLGAVTAVAFSPDGHFIVSGGDDCTVRLWPVSARLRQRPGFLSGRDEPAAISQLQVVAPVRALAWGNLGISAATQAGLVQLGLVERARRLASPVTRASPAVRDDDLAGW